jgi:creatinine amidohydrolase
VTVFQWSLLTRSELAARLPDAVVLMPTGATEQHGPHLVTGHDSVMVTAIAERATAASGIDVVLAPTLVFGSSAHHLPFGGTLSLATETYALVVRDLVRSAIVAGARRIFLLNGHGGNQELNVLAARDVALGQPREAPVTIGAASYWEMAASSIGQVVGMTGVPLPGHAGQFETAMMLAMETRDVREPRTERAVDPAGSPAVPGARVEVTGSWTTFDGYTDFPHLATVELGEELMEAVVRDVAAVLVRFAAVPLPGGES